MATSKTAQAASEQPLDYAEMREPKGTLVPDQTREEAKDGPWPDSQDDTKVRMILTESIFSAELVYGFEYIAR
jgi:hypothetical protein